ncbi:MAG: FAD:protein FMN transferase [Chryseolinea sp.]
MNHSRAIIYTIIFIASVLAVRLYGKNNNGEPIKIEGATMGTSYHITYFDSKRRNFKREIDSLLLVVNKSINTYDSSSEVSRFNRSKKGIAFKLPHLYLPIKKAEEVFNISQGAFDITVMPLINVWGFGPEKQLRPDKAMIDSIKTFVGFTKLKLANDSITKQDERVQLDFGGIGQGYGADVITQFLKSKGITNMLIELGGEGMAVGKNLKSNKPWQIGILNPNSTLENQFFKAYVALENKSFTTSGNYFNYREVDGKKYTHTIDPSTGFPAQRAILSASIFSADCTTADAWATAMMVMGHEKAIELLKKHPEMDALLIYTSPQGKMETYITPGVKSLIQLEP